MGFESITWCQEKKLTNFDFKHLYWRFNIVLAGYFFASKSSYTLQLWAFRFALSFYFLRREAGMVQMAFAYVWALNNTYLKRHHKETTVLSNHSFLTVLWENQKNTESQMSPFLVEKTRRCYKFYFFTLHWPITCILSSSFTYLVQPQNICINTFNTNPKSQHHSIAKLYNFFFFLIVNMLVFSCK